MLPERWQAINSYGIRIKHRTYDDGELGPLRRQHSGVMEKKGLWEIHHDPYDISRIWVRDRRRDRWITVFWKHLRRVGVPFGELAWDHACEQVPGGTEEQIADAAAALLRRAHDGPAAKKGPAAKRSRRVAARTRATAPDRPAPIRPPPRSFRRTRRTPRWRRSSRWACSIRSPTPGGVRDHLRTGPAHRAARGRCRGQPAVDHPGGMAEVRCWPAWTPGPAYLC
ncbi:Mu transposase C-terminal domain-containing protein [Streptomyces sp. TR1341]|uniref:Mu transposase C-terminal domain-containing protein n=1 Tax=Streptomyces sp. TR1341 TaxID=2601266 RepID=UPI00308465AB